jgi:hypothetical protein
MPVGIRDNRRRNIVRETGLMSAMIRTLCAALALLTVACAAAAPADARFSRKKSMWGPVEVNGVSQFPIYRDLGVGIWQSQLNWHDIAPTKPARPGDPADPAYRWPAEMDRAVAEAAASGIQVSLMLIGAPRWANGNRSFRYAPRRPADFATFARAASRRYPTVRHWMIWGEPTRRANFMPLTPESRPDEPTQRVRPLTARGQRAPRTYARMLDAAYVQLKRQSRANLVIGGNSFTTGDISPRNWIRYLRLANGKPPRMDLYGHNPFSARRPDLSKPPSPYGFADFSDLDTLGGWVDRYLSRAGRNSKRLRLFLSEFFIPTDHRNREFNFYVTRPTQASWLRSALRITRRSSRIYTLGWFRLYDDPRRPQGDEVNRGLLDAGGARKPAYAVYREG